MPVKESASFKKGNLVWYLQRDGSYTEAKVILLPTLLPQQMHLGWQLSWKAVGHLNIPPPVSSRPFKFLADRHLQTVTIYAGGGSGCDC